MRRLTPEAGAYAAEGDFLAADWQRGASGAHYSRLLAMKRRHDPDGLFLVHHGVGSKGWSADGLTRLGRPAMSRAVRGRETGSTMA